MQLNSTLQLLFLLLVVAGCIASLHTLKPSGSIAVHEGNGFKIFRPYYSGGLVMIKILGPPEPICHYLGEVLRYLDLKTVCASCNSSLPLRERAIIAYAEMLKSHVTGIVYGKSEKSVAPALMVQRNQVGDFNADHRQKGLDWTYLGVTMAGTLRMENIFTLLMRAFEMTIPGAFMETGVWRGGSSIFARGIIRAAKQGHRLSYVCDSFSGLPPGNVDFGQGDIGWDKTKYLEVSTTEVANHFEVYSLLDPNVVFVKGFFNESMPQLQNIVGDIAILRMDGDIYQSTVDVLYHMYDKVALNGFVIIDDWFGFPAKTACEDFFRAHNINPTIVPIDPLAVYWQKTEQVTIQYERYQTGNFV